LVLLLINSLRVQTISITTRKSNRNELIVPTQYTMHIFLLVQHNKSFNTTIENEVNEANSK
jgi:hypothetical protein